MSILWKSMQYPHSTLISTGMIGVLFTSTRSS